MISLKHLSVGYSDTLWPVLNKIDLQAASGSFICLLGRNGAGKSTLLRTLAGLQSPLSGEALIEEQPVHKMGATDRAQQISVVLTERQFGLGLTVEDVVAMGRQPHTGWRGKLSEKDCVIVKKAMDQAEVSVFSGRYIDDLSDGEKQRVMIARAIAQTPKFMLLDEITAFLDLPGRVASMLLLKQYAIEHDATVILSSHDLELSLQLADTIWLLDSQGGCIAETPQALQESGAIGAVFDTDVVRYSTVSQQFELLG